MAILKFCYMLDVNMDQVKIKSMCKRLEPSHLAKYIILYNKRTHAMVFRATTTKIRLCHIMVVRATNKLMVFRASSELKLWCSEEQENTCPSFSYTKNVIIVICECFTVKTLKSHSLHEYKHYL